MAKKEDLNELYKTIASDPLTWLEQAELLNISAVSIYQNIIKSYTNEQFSPSAKSKSIMGFMSSYMMLSGYAFENILKGISVAKFPEEDINNLKKKYWNYRGGHGISEIAKNLINDLAEEELNVLIRCEEFLFWAGRYPIPLTDSIYFQSKHPKNKLRLNSKDYEIRNQLFDRLRSILVKEWEELNNENYFETDVFNEIKNEFINKEIPGL